MSANVFEVAVACVDASGCATMQAYVIDADDREAAEEKAKQQAAAAGYVAPFLIFSGSSLSEVRITAQTLRLVPSLVVVDNSGGAIHSVGCDAGEVDVVIFGDDTESADEDALEWLPLGANEELKEVWTSRWTAQPSAEAQTLFDYERGTPIE
ncbi:hypothetical protein E4T66_17260 [Sinimarinibacterium sp. CAU 1509]|uniref:hypothetical protein n=1 Tax=Sinimarinibacterium sp. CAU 1509 TaxID=2562283 RepID=UPI0010AD3F06|nr:hypothetical protein [Sinimarinibacterium sp. CAU 1509]TJY57160.1 hypothetical protein E4T66_17260 [Sinimarinibacterium sp. CAU 1509]